MDKNTKVVRNSDAILDSVRYIVPATELAAAAEKKATTVTTKTSPDKGEQ